jgi:hypothetical protein
LNFRICFFGLALSLLAACVFAGDTLPATEDVNRLADAGEAVAASFKTASREVRFQYEYSGRFLKLADKEKLLTLARQGSEELQKILESQQKIKSQIEAYQGDDWEDKYGETGLWRKLFADIYLTNVRRLVIDFQFALHADDALRKERVHELLGRIDALEQDYDTAYLHFLRARVLGLMASSDPAYKSLARRQLDMLLDRSDMRQATAFWVAIERIKLFGPGENNRPAQLTNELAQSDSRKDPELVMSLACLQHRLNMPQAFEKTLSLAAGIENFMGIRVLQDLDYRLKHNELDLEKTSLIEAELAAQAAWAETPENWTDLLLHLSESPKFRTPLILYVTALSCAEARPKEAVEILMQAAKIQKGEKSERLGLEAEKIAEQAAKLACNAYAAGHFDEHTALAVFETCRQSTDGWTDEELEYCYAATLMATGQKEKAAQLLGKIAETPNARRRCRAKLDLITSRITHDHYSDATKRVDVSKDLLDLLRTCSEPNDPANVRPEAMLLYCRLMLESPESSEAQKVVDILTDAELRKAPELRFFKSKALRYLGRLEESAECLVEICRADNHEHAIEAEKVLTGIIERFEQLQSGSADAAKLQENSLALAQYCERTSRTSCGLIPAGQAQLYVAEMSLPAAAKDPQKLVKIEAMLDALPDEYKKGSVDFLRCRARLLTEQGKFAEAGGLWAKVAGIEKKRSAPPNQRNAQWWRAKYYELYCFSKTPQTKAEDVVHGIEILQNGFGDIPPLWAEKLETLKQLCSKGVDNTRRL